MKEGSEIEWLYSMGTTCPVCAAIHQEQRPLSQKLSAMPPEAQRTLEEELEYTETAAQVSRTASINAPWADSLPIH